MFGLLGLSPGPDIGLRAAANLAGLSPARTRAVLGELEDASLILRPAPSRYQVHDLVRLYAAECAEADLDPNARGEARRRLLDYYVHTAHAGDRVLHPHRDLVEPEPAGGECRPDPLTTEPEALAWFDAEHASLLLVQEQALAQGWNRAAWQLAWTLDTFHWRRGHLRDDVTVWQAALTASERLDEPLPKVKADRRLGLALARVGGHEAALDYLRKSLELAERIGDRNEQAHIHWCFAWTWDNQREDARALDHAERALSLFRELGQPEWEAETRNEMGRYCARLGHLDEARAHCEAALALCREHGYVEGEASVLDVLGFVARQAGQYSPAIEHYRQALRLYRDLGYSYEEPNVLDGLGHAHVGGDSPGDARQAWLQALDLYAGQHRTADAERMDRQITALGAP
jgi:tetratricopeptide (TPR) repeat protein